MLDKNENPLSRELQEEARSCIHEQVDDGDGMWQWGAERPFFSEVAIGIATEEWQTIGLDARRFDNKWNGDDSDLLDVQVRLPNAEETRLYPPARSMWRVLFGNGDWFVE